jgi:3-oxoacyl-[acyl-carrier protein] reductase
MNDFLLELGKNPTARQVVKNLGLPLPMPQALARAQGPTTERLLQGQDIAVRLAPESALSPVLARLLNIAGAQPHVVGEITASFLSLGEAYGHPPKTLDIEAISDDFRVNSIIFDATDLQASAHLIQLYRILNPLIRRIRKNGRLIVLGRPPACMHSPGASAAQAALEGFVRSAAKECGKSGTTGLLLRVEPGAENRVEEPLRFLLSRRSAYISGQPLDVDNRVPAPQVSQIVCPLERKVAVVTGGARGIGQRTAEVLAGEGAHVLLIDRPEDDGPAAKAAAKIGASVLLMDVTDPNAGDILADRLESLGGADILVHNAGVTRDKTLARMSEAQWSLTLAVNLQAIDDITAVLLARKALNRDSRIICLSSIGGIAGNMGQTNYAASKAGVIGWVEHLAGSLAIHGTTVNAVAPGFIETRMTAAMPMGIREAARRMNNLSQGGRPDDIAQAIAFLANPRSYGVTGRTLRVCGGSLVGR